MEILIIGLLAIALGAAWVGLWSHRRAIKQLNQALARRKPFLVEKRSVLSSDGWRELSARTNELLAENDRLQRIRSDQLAQLEATLGSLQEAVLIVDSANTVLLANKALRAIFPNAINILGHRLERILHSVPFLNYVDAVRRNQAEPQHEVEFIEGSITTWVELTGTLVAAPHDPKGPWALFVLHDITKQKKLEMVRKEFVANVSHELRTPLSVIKGFVETLVDGGEGVSPADRDRFLRTIQRHTERLNSLLEDLLMLSRLESINPGLKREPLNLRGLIEDVVADCRSRPSAETYQIFHDIDAAVGSVLADPLKIAQVLENLLDNALKYAPKGSRLDISATLKGREIEVCVRDNGPGIPVEDLPHIFERFYRVDKGRSRDKGGTGLGLSIVKHIVQLHGGRVWVESRLGQGSAFFFTLPTRTGA